jgi:hypothetical protein
MSAQLFHELSALLPQAVISLISKHAWHSLSFRGTRIVLSVVVAKDDHYQTTAEFERILPSHDFRSAGGLVADIAVTERATADKESRLIVHALLLDD